MPQKNTTTQSVSNKVKNSVLPENKYSSVEFCIKDLVYNYQFRIWETENPEINILVNRNSILMKHLHAGSTLDIKYYPSGGSRYPVTMKTEIKHIKENSDKRLEGHCLVGLSVH